jgi:hypothetical protein
MSAAQAVLDRVNETNRRIDRILDARADALNSQAEEERRDLMRKHADRCTEHRLRYDAVFQPFGRRAPEPAADDAPPDYRRRLIGHGLSMLPSNHEMVGIDPEELGPSAVVPIEQKLFEALQQEAENPSYENLPDTVNDPRAKRETYADDSGRKVITFHAKTSFVKDFAARPQRVLRICDPNKGIVLWGRPFDRVPPNR